jgi:salicylate hydroxylase
LEKHNPGAASPSTELLSTIFLEYEGIRIPRMAEVVDGGRKHHKLWILDGVEACLARNNAVRKIWKDEEEILHDSSKYYMDQPFKGKSEI